MSAPSTLRRPGRRVDLNLWLLLGALASIASWLVPDHRDPWPAFYNELLAAAGLVPLATWTGTGPAAQVCLPRSAQFVLLVALVPVVQALLGQIRYAGDAALAVMYLVGLAMSITIGSQWRQRAPASISSGLPLTALFAALLTFALALMQWLGIDELGVLLASLPPHAQLTGNIAQANHMATLMAWGVIATWFLYEQRRIRGSVALATASLLLLGIVMSQSRTGWVHVALIVGVGLIFGRRCPFRLTALPALLLAGAFAATVALWGALNRALDMAPALTLVQRTAAGPRLAIWHQFMTAIELSPWFGYGWTQDGLAQQAALSHTPPLNIVMSYAHNLVLDLFVWNGVPLGLLIAAAMLAWAVARVRAIRTPEAALYALVLATFAFHSMVEFPHAYAYFLLPAGLVAGALEEVSGGSTAGGIAIPKWAWLVAVASMAGLLVWTTADYGRVERSLQQYRFEAAHIAGASGSVAPDIHLLTQLGALMKFVRAQPDQGLGEAELADMLRVVARFPSAGNQFRLALKLARNGRPREASAMLDQLCVIQRAPNCATAMAAWSAVAAEDPTLRAVPLPPHGRPSPR
jgi:hypothetical protein